MLKSQVINAPVISIDTGEALGKMNNLILDPVEQIVTGLVFSENKLFPYNSTHMVNLFDIQTIGPFAITIPHKDVIMHLDKGEFDNSLQFRAPEDKQVISDQGELIGICKDYDFCFPSGELTSIIISNRDGKDGEFAIPREQLVTLGNDYIIISYHLEPTSDYSYPDMTQASAPHYQAENLLGKVVTQTIQDGYGNILIQEGEIITPELLEIATNHNIVNTLAVVAHGNGVSHDAQDVRKQEEWQSRLSAILNQTGTDIEEKLKSFLISKRPAYSVYSQSGQMLKEKGKPIQVRDIQNIKDKNDLLRLTASITASELNEFMTFVEDKVQKLMSKGNSK